MPNNSMVFGFSKENSFKAFMETDKVCLKCAKCEGKKCHIFVAKMVLTNMYDTGRKLSDVMPSDFLELIRHMPILDKPYSPFQLRIAQDSIFSDCDRCSTHTPFCNVNLVATLLGILTDGKDYKTPKDQELYEVG